MLKHELDEMKNALEREQKERAELVKELEKTKNEV